MQELTAVHDLPALPPRPNYGHKGTFGTVVVVGGSATMLGAPAICAASALRVGTGLAKIAASPELLPAIIGIEPSATGIALAGDIDAKREALDHADPDDAAVLAVGPGLGDQPELGAWVMALLRGERPVVLDADGLNHLAQRGAARPTGGPELVMTPHPGEFRRLARPLQMPEDPTDPDQRPRAAARLAQTHRAVVVLKGRATIVTDGQRIYTNKSGNVALATAGTGDVLTGAIAGLIAQGMNGFDAAMLAVHAHGRAAELWSAAHDDALRGLKAMELSDLLHRALQQVS